MYYILLFVYVHVGACHDNNIIYYCYYHHYLCVLCAWHGDYVEGRRQFCGVDFLSHLDLGSRDHIWVSRLAQQVPLPDESLHQLNCILFRAL